MPQSISAKLFAAFRARFECRFPVNAPRWNGKDIKLIGLLIDEQGQERAQEYILWALDNFTDVLRPRFRLGPYPTVGILWGFRMAFLGIMNEPRANSITYHAKVNRQQHAVVRDDDADAGRAFLSR